MAFKPVLGSPHVLENERVFIIKPGAQHPKLVALVRAAVRTGAAYIPAARRFDETAARFKLGYKFPMKKRDELTKTARRANAARKTVEEMVLSGRFLHPKLQNNAGILAAVGWKGNRWVGVDVRRAVVDTLADGSVTLYAPRIFRRRRT